MLKLLILEIAARNSAFLFKNQIGYYESGVAVDRVHQNTCINDSRTEASASPEQRFVMLKCGDLIDIYTTSMVNKYA